METKYMLSISIKWINIKIESPFAISISLKC